jgi:SAM-dependent methyltransferase
MLKRIINRLRLYLPSAPKKTFTRIYKKNAWNSRESVSGPGSTLVATENLRLTLPALLKKWQIKSILDAPCGDFNWMSKVELGGVTYTGADIVPQIIEQNKIKYPEKNFFERDIINDPLPYADLVLCKDCFIHLKNQDVLRAIDNFKKTGIRYLLASTYPVDFNKQILTGHYRATNLEKPPFNLGEPLDRIEDNAEDGTQRWLGLWKLND